MAKSDEVDMIGNGDNYKDKIVERSSYSKNPNRAIGYLISNIRQVFI